MQIEERTISKVGSASLMVTLPKGWLRYMGIKAGDIVEVVTNGEVIIRPKRKMSRRQPKQTARPKCIRRLEVA